MGFFKSISNILSGKVEVGNNLQAAMFEINVKADEYDKLGNEFMSAFYKYLFGGCFSYARSEFETCYQLPEKYIKNVDSRSCQLYKQLIVVLYLKYYLDVSKMSKNLHNINMTEDELVDIIFNDINVDKLDYKDYKILAINFEGDMSMFWLVWTKQLMKNVYKQAQNECDLADHMLDVSLRMQMFNSTYDQFKNLFGLPDPRDYKLGEGNLTILSR